jgi:hypothetical protein
MGAHQSINIKFLVQDAEFDDIFVNHLLNKTDKFIHYLVGDKAKFTGDVRDAKDSLLECFNMKPIAKTPTLFTDGNGVSTKTDMEKFSTIVKNDLISVVDMEGFTITLILTGQCAPFVKVFTTMLCDEYINPSNVEIYLVNGQHNGQGIFNELLTLKQVTDDMSTNLVIHEFNAFSSMGPKPNEWAGEQKFVDWCTSDEFNKSVIKMSKNHNDLARGLVHYASLFNKSLLNKPVDKIKELIHVFNELWIDYDLSGVCAEVESYINTLFDSCDVLNTNVCQILSKDLNRVIGAINYALSVSCDNDIRCHLFKFRSWFKVKAYITECNLLCFPLHDMAGLFMYYKNTIFTPFKSYGVEMGRFFDIHKEPVKDVPFVEVLHYVAKNPDEVRKHIESAILEVLHLQTSDEV